MVKRDSIRYCKKCKERTIHFWSDDLKKRVCLDCYDKMPKGVYLR